MAPNDMVRASEGFTPSFCFGDDVIEDEPNILDLRDMPLFFEDISEESYVPMTGPKRLDGLSRPHVSGETPKKRRRELPWLALVLLLVLTTTIGTALALRHTPVVNRPLAVASKTAASPSVPALPAIQVEPQIAYVNLLGALTIHSTPEFNIDNSLGAVPYGDPVTVLEQVDAWWTKVNYQGTVGYMSRYYLVDSQDQLTGATLPAIADSSAPPTAAPADQTQTVAPSNPDTSGTGSATTPGAGDTSQSTGSSSNTNNTNNQTTTTPDNTTNPSP